MEKKVLIVGLNDVSVILAKRFLENKEITLAILSDKKSEESIKELKSYGDLEVFLGDFSGEILKSAVEGADFVINLNKTTAVESSHNPDETERINYFTTKNLVDAVKDQNTKFIEISSSAVYGAHTPRHPYARVGDAVMPALYDINSATIARAERYLIENGRNFLIIRSSAIFSDGTINKWLFDGYIFHNPLFSPFDFVSADEVSELLYKIVLDDEKIKYNSIYNFGGTRRLSWYDAIELACKTLHISTGILSPNWFGVRNGNMAWLSDGNVLRELYDTNEEKFENYISEQNVKYAYSRKINGLSFLIKKIILGKVQNMKNAPLYWKDNVMSKRVEVFYKGYDGFNKIPDSFSKIDRCVFSDEKIYNVLPKNIYLTFDEIENYAVTRGGHFISKDYKMGDIHTKYNFVCGNGHNFKATPYAVVFGGFWCTECAMPPKWDYSEVAKTSSYHSVIYFDEWEKNENIVVTADDYHDIEKIDKFPYVKNTDKIKAYPKG